MSRTMGFELEPFHVDVVNIYPGTIDTAFEENALREEERPGLCPRDHCGLPRTDIARKVIAAAEGAPGDRYLERPCRWYSLAGLLRPEAVKRRLQKMVLALFGGMKPYLVYTVFDDFKGLFVGSHSGIEMNIEFISIFVLQESAVMSDPLRDKQWFTAGNAGAKCTHGTCFFKDIIVRDYDAIICVDGIVPFLLR